MLGVALGRGSSWCSAVGAQMQDYLTIQVSPCRAAGDARELAPVWWTLAKGDGVNIDDACRRNRRCCSATDEPELEDTRGLSGVAR